MGHSKGPWNAAALVGLIGIDLSCATFGGFWLGRTLDRWLHSDPVCMIVGVLLGLAVGIFSISKLIKPFLGE